MKSFEIKARDYYGEVVINKGLMARAGFGERRAELMNPAGSRSPASWENIFRKRPTKIES